MVYRVIAEATMVVHFLFLVFVVTGGFLAWRRPRVIWAHLAAAAWGLGSVALGWDCPLTYVEDWGRRMAGQEGLPPSGFIDHYIEGVIYPAEHAPLLQGAAAVLVVVSWIGFVRLRARNHGPVGGRAGK